VGLSSGFAFSFAVTSLCGRDAAPQHRIMAEDVGEFSIPDFSLLFLHLRMYSWLDRGQ